MQLICGNLIATIVFNYLYVFPVGMTGFSTVSDYVVTPESS